MNKIEKSRIQEITQLHSEIGGYLKMTLDKAIRIGELLHGQKAECGHGNWLPWVKNNLSFSERVAQDYIRFYDRRKELKSARVADLSEARLLLAETVEIKVVEEISQEVHGLIEDIETLPEMIRVLIAYERRYKELGKKFPVDKEQRFQCARRELYAGRFIGMVLNLWEEIPKLDGETALALEDDKILDGPEFDALQARWDEVVEKYEWLRGPAFQKKMREQREAIEKEVQKAWKTA